METGSLTDEQIKKYKEHSQSISTRSDFKFLSGHRGLRPDNLHLFLGSSGDGKSTLMRSILIDVLEWKKRDDKILLHLSEETPKEFKIELSKTGFKKDSLDSLHIQTEVGKDKRSILQLKEKILSKEYKYFIYDNITTSELYEPFRPQEQTKVAKSLKSCLKEAGCLGLFFAHTNADIGSKSTRLVDMTDIRGGKGVVNLAEFIYIIQRFQCGKLFFPTLRVVKHRGQEMENMFFALQYNKNKFIYDSDKVLDWGEFNELYKTRNVLGK